MRAARERSGEEEVILRVSVKRCCVIGCLPGGAHNAAAAALLRCGSYGRRAKPEILLA
ncbi:hypothetical protein PCAR4_340069 [Paraburkholderia caribensis]|nr:hypothetical protein PCAR4_340069 [Paraburkholderia caribensis]